jgi:hypothetical protein
MRTDLIDYYPRIPSIYERVPSDAILAEFPVGREIDYMYFSTSHWGRLLSGYSGFIPADADLAADVESFPAVDSLAGLRRRGATNLTYNCAFERSPERCRYNTEELAASGQLELVATETWQGASVQLCRFK